MHVSAVIPGAGKSLRFFGESNSSSPQNRKQFEPLGGVPLILRTLQPFLLSPVVELIVVVAPDDSIEWMMNTVRPYRSENRIVVVPGGERRQDSVWNGLSAVPGNCDIVIVHDAVRPFFKQEWIKTAIDLCSEYDGAIVAVQARDTLKRIKDNTILGTLPRGEIWQAQTPQTFRKDILISAFENALKSDITCTDEAQLVELIGGRIAVIEGDQQNIKITKREDWELAESIWGKLIHD